MLFWVCCWIFQTAFSLFSFTGEEALVPLPFFSILFFFSSSSISRHFIFFMFFSFFWFSAAALCNDDANGNVPLGKSCNRYWSCQGGYPRLQRCPAQLVFDKHSLRCVVPPTEECEVPPIPINNDEQQANGVNNNNNSNNNNEQRGQVR